MLDGRYVSSKAIVEAVLRDYSFRPTDVDIEAMKEHIFDAMLKIGVPTAFKDEVDVIQITDYIGELPCGLIDIHPGMVRMHGTQRPLIWSSDRFYSVHMPVETQTNSPDINDPYYTAYSDAPTIMDKDTYAQYYTYYLNDNYIFTNFSDGYVDIAYKAFPVEDCCGEQWPLVPDNVRYIEGVRTYCAERIGFKAWMRGDITDKVYQKLEQDRIWNIASANTAGRVPSLDQMESLKNQWLTLNPDLQQHSQSFRYLNRRQRIRTHTS